MLQISFVSLVALTCLWAQPVGAQGTSPLVIEAGGPSLASTTRDAKPSSPLWVAIASLDSDGDLVPVAAEDCASAVVTFRLHVPNGAGFAPRSHETSAVVVDGETLSTWGRASTTSLHGIEDRDDKFCVAYAFLRLAAEDGQQTVTARVSRRGAPPSPSALSYGAAGADVGRAEYVFGSTMLDSSGTRMVIVDRSVGGGYAFAGAQLEGTYLVALGTWSPDSTRSSEERVGSPSARDCASTQVRFTLWSPKEQGVAPMTSTVSAHVVAGTGMTRRLPQWAPDSLGSDDFRRQAYVRGREAACVAEAPVRLGPQAGDQRVSATVVGSGTGIETAAEEAMLTNARRSPTGSVEFDDVRAHARPRAMVGLVYTPNGTADVDTLYRVERLEDAALTTTDTVTVDTRRYAPMVGVDFPLEPVLGSVPLVRGVASWFARARLTVGTRIGDAFGRTAYVGLSVPTLVGGRDAANVPFDFTMGATFDARDDTDPYFSATLLLDLNDAIGGVASAFGL